MGGEGQENNLTHLCLFMRSFFCIRLYRYRFFLSISLFNKKSLLESGPSLSFFERQHKLWWCFEKIWSNFYAHLKDSIETSEKLIGVGCPAHIIHNTIQHGSHALADNLEVIVMKVLNHFSIYKVRVSNLKPFCQYVDVRFKNRLSHSLPVFASCFGENVGYVWTIKSLLFLSW